MSFIYAVCQTNFLGPSDIYTHPYTINKYFVFLFYDTLII